MILCFIKIKKEKKTRKFDDIYCRKNRNTINDDTFSLLLLK